MSNGSFESIAAMAASLPDPQTIGRMAQQQAEALERSRERLNDLVGSAASEDGLIEATATDAKVLSLTLDPRAMRKASQDLAAEIVEAVNAARIDFDAQRQEVLAELGVGAGPSVDMSTAMNDMRDMGDALQRSTADIQALVERFQRQAGR